MTQIAQNQEAPALTPQQIALVRKSFEAVVPIRETAATLFYARLFEIAPEVRPLFSRDLSAQGTKLMAALAMVARNLDRIDDIRPEIEKLALRHVSYGAVEAHYPAVGEALLWTLEQGLGESFGDDVRDAWTTAYALLSGAMIAASSSVEPMA